MRTNTTLQNLMGAIIAVLISVHPMWTSHHLSGEHHDHEHAHHHADHAHSHDHDDSDHPPHSARDHELVSGFVPKVLDNDIRDMVAPLPTLLSEKGTDVAKNRPEETGDPPPLDGPYRDRPARAPPIYRVI